MSLFELKDVKTVTVSQPLFLKGSTGKGVLLIHGYTGSPHDMVYLANRLNEEGYTVLVPRLPGHGTSSKDFLESNWRDWLRRGLDSYFDLSGLCEEVYIGGLSMGGVLALILASIVNPKKIVSIAGAIFTVDKRIALTPLISLFTKKMKRKIYFEKYENKDLEYLSKEYWSYNWPLQAKYLYKLMKIARKRIRLIRSDILILASEKDETVPLKAAHYIYNNVSSEKRKLEVFKESGHVMTNDVEKEKVADKIIEWFRE
ncbi:esterase [Thermosipho melanesiensis]|uniref:Esterase/lipase-like protein n=2 Tax=Thermosipho melanesiensis TaxID=46541 RepID=A6LLC9_THEM4|nr:alpha/beta fold hydrolase [Thermosipho melanesiensis]ABR30730.1 Esterase/lipase-like protein [Thermosipho melanesiensis BI429]APT73856.1 esterase [Thermosipho melanesiensis]OOC35797.1 esterase [Thermosipho melanesiensis]OOC38299.1 esterase [Thermosipho melanesiensis]OOC38760.1 esterase [Thermosipho melanesiensis]